jgi:WD40 repeat protein
MPRLMLLMASACVLLIASPAIPTEPTTSEERTGDAVRTDRYGDPLPQGAVARLGTLRLRKTGSITSVAFSPDGKTVTWVGNGVEPWDLATGKECRHYIGNKTAIHSHGFTPDGKTVIAVEWTTATVLLWDAATGRLRGEIGKPSLGEILELWHPASDVRHWAISPDGNSLVTTRYGIRFWDIATAKQTGRIDCDGWPEGGTSVAFSPDSRVLATSDAAHNVRLWNVATGRVTHRLAAHKNAVLCLAFSPDGKTLASAGKDCKVCLWNPQNGESRRTIAAHTQPVHSVFFTPDGSGLITASYERISLWDRETGKQVRSFAGQGRGYMSAALSRDGRLLAAGGRDGTLRLWNVATGMAVLSLDGHRDNVYSLAFHPDGRTLASGGGDEARIWSVESHKTVRRLGDDGPPCHAVAYSGDGKWLACAGSGGIRVWDAVSGKEQSRLILPKDDARHVAFTPDGNAIVCRHWRGICRVWDWRGARVLREFGDPDEHGPICFALSPDGTLAAVEAPDKTVKLWRCSDGRLFRTLDVKVQSGGSVAFSPDGNLLAVASEGICVFDIETGKEIQRLTGYKSWVPALAFSPDGRSLASGGDDEDIRLWEIGTGKERRRFRGHLPSVFNVTCLAFSGCGKYLASGGDDKTILVWDVTVICTQESVRPRALHEQNLAAIWAGLADSDASRAYQAMCCLVHAPAQALPFLKVRLRPARDADAVNVAKLLADLDSDRFDVREKASEALGKLGGLAESALNQFLKGNPSAEARKRAERLLEKITADPTGEVIRALRAIEVLEHIGTPAACQLLKALAGGAPEARLTREAKASLDRLSTLALRASER